MKAEPMFYDLYYWEGTGTSGYRVLAGAALDECNQYITIHGNSFSNFIRVPAGTPIEKISKGRWN